VTRASVLMNRQNGASMLNFIGTSRRWSVQGRTTYTVMVAAAGLNRYMFLFINL